MRPLTSPLGPYWGSLGVLLGSHSSAPAFVGIRTPLQEVGEPTSGEVYEVFSESELKRLAANVLWLRGSERSFDLWENEEDDVYDSL